MFVNLEKLSVETDGRYASDDELEFINTYIKSFSLRKQVYQKLKSLEAKIVEQVYTKLRSLDPKLLQNGAEDVSDKWKRDTLRVLRYVALTVLIDDDDNLKNQFLIWFQTIMQAFNAERSCDATYNIMQQVVKQLLEPQEVALVSPVLELNRNLLGKK
ncbi:Phycobilisome protein [Synechococcus sp. PCC 7502]|uniref:phycobilisome protein n=1 Tax=Synechococcus sp. PCC 7502 TaxID=1173263 RepID=UPI00029FF711|nr:phycobilisome protein [Synechococcus sp. PCC 7502]AFY72286.1 Phycobilisome protein [Synechococcus sp. PCC 7502]